MKKFASKVIVALLVGLGASGAMAGKIKDVANVKGVRSNPILGYGLVIGLDGTGDQTSQTRFTAQSIESMLSQMDVNLPPGTNLQTKNVASVIITAELPPHATPGQRIDITVSSIGNAKSLRGGTLLMTPMKGPDGQVYALAQGNVVVVGAGAESGRSSKKINHLSAGRIPEGAVVERPAPRRTGMRETIQLELKSFDYANAKAVSLAIDKAFGPDTANPIDGRTIEVINRYGGENEVAFLAEVQELDVETVVGAAKVIINSRTGSVVMNQSVQLKDCAVSHGNLTVSIQSTPVISQPNPFSEGRTVEASLDTIEIDQAGGELIKIDGSKDLNDVVKALNAMGTKPDDLIAILQAMKEAGSLQADISII